MKKHRSACITSLLALSLFMVSDEVLCQMPSKTASDAAVTTMPLITIEARNGVPIDSHLYGSNNYWYSMPDARFDAFVKSAKEDFGITLLRFPGGFESEHYRWDSNTLEQSYRNYTPVPGATPEHALAAMGPGNVTFVVRTQDALEADSPAAYESWANQAAKLVATYGDRVRDWQIGNEWYNVGGAHKRYPEFVRRYATLLGYFAPAMKKAAAAKGYNIRLYASVNWVKPEDVKTMRAVVPSNAWDQIDGMDLHIYTGSSPDADKVFPPLAISAIQPTIATIKRDSGKDLVYVSEWMASLQDDDHRGGLSNANTMMEILGDMALAGVQEAAYWPPVWPAKENGKPAPQSDTVTLVRDDLTYSVDADGQAMKWLSTGYRGEALRTAAANTSVKSIAAKDGNQITVFIMSGKASNETERIRINGFHWSRILSAEVMYAEGAHADSGPALKATAVASREDINGEPVVKVVVNPGGEKRGSQWEIVKLVLR